METHYMEKQVFDYDANPFAIDDTQNDIPPSVHLYEPVQNKFRWHHVEDLDTFFTKIYNYHQKNGFLCMMVEEIFEPIQFLFIIILTFFLLHCINYSQLFRTHKWISHNITQSSNRNLYLNENSQSQTVHGRISLWEALEPISVCTQKHYKRTHPFLIICLILASVFLLIRIIRIFQHFFQYWEIRSFYLNALKINTDDLPNTTWQDIQTQLKRVQREQRLCIHKTELSDLDIHHRILRYQNYMVAFVNKDLFPLHINIPFVGEVILLSQALQYNLEMILFWGPWSPFKSNWQLKEEYKKSGQRLIVANRLSRHIMCVAIVNLLLSPVILIWQLLYFFFNYGQLIKNEPGALLGTRRWSPYARIYFRHYNELDHQLRARLARAYPHARKYVSSFVSPLAVILAKNVCFFTGSILAVVILLTLIDEDVLLSTEHVLTFATVLGVIYGACRTLVLPWDEVETEGEPCCRQTLMDRILAHVHYLPADWMTSPTPGGVAASRSAVRDAFSARFYELRVVHFLREALSALAVPYVLLVGVRPRALTIVDFFRNYTVEVEGVGDVCSFARMDPPTFGNDVPHPSAPEDESSSITPPIHEETIASDDEERNEILGPLIGRVGRAGKRPSRSLRVADKACSPLPPLDLEPPSSFTPAIPKTALSLINFAVVDGGLTPTGPSARYLTGLKRQAESVFSGITRPDRSRVDDDDPNGPELSSVMASLVTMSTLGGGYTLVANDMLRNLPATGVRTDDYVVSSHHVTREKMDDCPMGGSIWLPPSRGVTLSSYPTNAVVPHVMLHHSLIELGREGVGGAPPSFVVPHTKNTVISYSVIDMSLTVLYLHNKARNEQARKQLKKQTSLEEPFIKDDSLSASPLFSSMGKSVKFKDLLSASSAKIFENNEEKCPLLMKSFNPPKYDV